MWEKNSVQVMLITTKLLLIIHDELNSRIVLVTFCLLITLHLGRLSRLLLIDFICTSNGLMHTCVSKIYLFYFLVSWILVKCDSLYFRINCVTLLLFESSFHKNRLWNIFLSFRWNGRNNKSDQSVKDYWIYTPLKSTKMEWMKSFSNYLQIC